MFLERSGRNMGGVLQGRNLLIPVIRPDDRREENAMWSSTAERSSRNGEVKFLI